MGRICPAPHSSGMSDRSQWTLFGGIVCFTLAWSSSACIHDVRQVPAEHEFGSVRSLSDLDGVYRNAGTREDGAAPGQPLHCSRHLSSLIWPQEQNLPHKQIETIEVRAVGEHSLLVRAFSGAKCIHSSTFEQGRHFTLEGGRLLGQPHFEPLSEGSGDVLVGPRSMTLELGLDRGGAGKSRQTQWAAGLVFLLIPTGLYTREDFHFEKIAP
jgi:hypothetical protein